MYWLEANALYSYNISLDRQRDLDEPRSIVLDLETGWMFWSDWGRKPRIERAWMDGTNKETIIDTELVW